MRKMLSSVAEKGKYCKSPHLTMNLRSPGSPSSSGSPSSKNTISCGHPKMNRREIFKFCARSNRRCSDDISSHPQQQRPG